MPLIPVNRQQGAEPLTTQQKKFNTHIQRIARQRQRLKDWASAVDAYRQRHAREFMPLWNTHRALLVELVHLLDREHGRKGLTKAERATLAESLADLAGHIAQHPRDQAEHEAMQEIHTRYADPQASQWNAQEQDMARAVAKAVFGVDLQGEGLDTTEDIARQVQEQMEAQWHARQQEAEQARAAHQAARRQKKPTARERKVQEENQQASQSLREVYRKLASSLHPDRETNPAERARKTALMQQANQAYAANDLLALLQLQLDAEQIDPQRMAGLGDERLKSYNRLLAEQLAALQEEVQLAEASFCAEFNLNPLQTWKPAKLALLLREQQHVLRETIADLQQQLRALREDPAELKRWIRRERIAARESAADEFDDLLSLMDTMGKKRTR